MRIAAVPVQLKMFAVAFLLALMLPIGGMRKIGCGSEAVGAEPAAGLTLPGAPEPRWDELFARSDGWTGGDADYSVDLKDGRTLWLFCDSWIGPVKDGRHAKGTRMINNAVCVHPTPAPGAFPRYDTLRFHRGKPNDKGEPTSWIVPEDGKGWFWPADAILTADATGKRRLVLTLWRLQKGPGAPGFQFKAAGGAIGIVDNVADPVEHWRIRQFTNPHAIGKDEAHERGAKEINWGAAVIESPDDAGTLYIYGVKEDGWNKRLLLARMPAAKVEDFTTWRFRTAGGQWSAKLDDAATICEGVANEVRVQPITQNGKRRWVLVHSEPLLGKHIFVRTADSPEGPWSARQPVFRVDIPREGYFTYAAKSHPHLAAEGELLISYIINAGDIWKALSDASIYRPRFVRVPVSAIR